MNRNDTAKVESDDPKRMAWSVAHRISWVEWRVRERTIKRGEYVDERGRWLLEAKMAGGRKFNLGDEVAEYAVWLFKVRDGLSWHQIAYRFFPTATETEIERYESRIRRVFQRVERRHPGSGHYRPPRLSAQERLILECVRYGVVPVYLDRDNRSVKSI
jgi:hypothetical protein